MRRSKMTGLGMNRRRCFPFLLLGLILLLTGLLVGCGHALTHISAEQDRITFVTRAGDNVLSESLEIYSWATDEPFTWEAKDDALWLKVEPSWGTFGSGVGEATAWVYISDMSVGHHSANISISVPEADNSPLTIQVDLDIQPPEDPAVVAAREFWESRYYNKYWDFNAAPDVAAAVRDYSFYSDYFSDPTITKTQEVEIKNIDFEYSPEIYERPIAMVHCIVTYKESERVLERWYDVVITTWTFDLDVVLEVEPEPYHIEHNEWQVIDYYPHEYE